MARTVARDIKKKFDKVARNLANASGPQKMRVYGIEALKLILERTRRGYGVAEYKGDKFRLPTFSPRYRKFREDNAGDLHSTTSPNARNNTFTGQMLHSMQVVKVTAKKFWLDATGTRDDGLKNADIARYITDGEYKGGKPRPFAFLSKSEVGVLAKMWKAAYLLLEKRSS